MASGAARPLILSYGNTDPDALASAWALQQLSGRYANRPRIGYTGEVGRLENQAMIENLRIPARHLQTTVLNRADLIALVDCQPEFFVSIDLPRCDIVIDPHPRKSRRKFAFSDIRPDGVVFCHLGVVPSSDICAQIADFLIHVKEAKWALVSGINQASLIVVFRCDGHRKHAGEIAEAAFGSLGSAAGHRNAARAEVEEDAIPRGIRL